MQQIIPSETILDPSTIWAVGFMSLKCPGASGPGVLASPNKANVRWKALFVVACGANFAVYFQCSPVHFHSEIFGIVFWLEPCEWWLNTQEQVWPSHNCSHVLFDMDNVKQKETSGLIVPLFHPHLSLLYISLLIMPVIPLLILTTCGRFQWEWSYIRGFVLSWPLGAFPPLNKTILVYALHNSWHGCRLR